jgi:RpiB/LacA/LacB family sugar-phosphate isomerase
MPIAIASDHGGFELKEEIKAFMDMEGIRYTDLGTTNGESVDYPDFGMELARSVSEGEFERGVLICGTGIGMSIVANKFPKVRAALVWDTFTARMAKEHNDANILVMGGRTTDKGLAREMVRVWLDARFEGGRHQRRLEKIREIEKMWGMG